MTGDNCAAGFACVGQIVNYCNPPGDGFALETKKLLHEAHIPQFTPLHNTFCTHYLIIPEWLSGDRLDV